MSLYPTHVEINEENILKITNTFKSAYKQIVSEISTATDFGVKNRRAILAQIDVILTTLGTNTQEFLAKELPEYYKSGADDAVKQLSNVGADVGVSEGFNRLHEQAIVALVDDTAKAFGESLTGVGRSADLLLGKTTRETITQKLAEGLIGGNNLKAVKRTIKGILQEQGLDALKDKGGHGWTLDRYAEMLFRTKAVESRNRGLVNRMVENEYDLVQVSNHFGACPLCAPWEGKILSLTGVSKGYPTLSDAESGGLFHPNAVLSNSTFTPYGELEEMIGADYEGPAIRIHTAQDHTLTIGPNHPVLTQRGLIKAGLLTEKDYLVYDSRVVAPEFTRDSNFQQMPLVEDAFETLLLSEGSITRIPTASHDLHGDRIFCKGKIKVVKPTSRLLPILDSSGIEQFRDTGFMETNMKIILLSGNSSSSFGLNSVNLSSPGSVSSTLSGYNFVHISSIHNIRFKGKAFDAQTSSGLYNSNGFVVSNCKHAINVLIPSLANKTQAYYPDERTKFISESEIAKASKLDLEKNAKS